MTKTMVSLVLTLSRSIETVNAIIENLTNLNYEEAKNKSLGFTREFQKKRRFPIVPE